MDRPYGIKESEYQMSATTWTATKKSTRIICNALFMETNATTKVHIIATTKIALVKARYFLHMTRHWALGPIKKNVETRRKMLHKVYGIANLAGAPANLRRERTEMTARRMAIPIHPNQPRTRCLYVSCGWDRNAFFAFFREFSKTGHVRWDTECLNSPMTTLPSVHL